MEELEELFGSQTVNSTEVTNSEFPVTAAVGETCLKMFLTKPVRIDRFTLSIAGGSSADVSINYIIKGETVEQGPGTFTQDEKSGVITAAVSVSFLNSLQCFTA